MHVEPGGRVEPEQMRPPDMYAAKLRGAGHLDLPIVPIRIHGSPNVGLFHFEFGEFEAMVRLDVLAGLTAHRLVKRSPHRTIADPGYPRDLRRRDSAQPERHDLLFALGYVGLGARYTFIAAFIHFRK